MTFNICKFCSEIVGRNRYLAWYWWQEYLTAQRNFVQSCAAYCIVSYLVQVGFEIWSHICFTHFTCNSRWKTDTMAISCSTMKATWYTSTTDSSYPAHQRYVKDKVGNISWEYHLFQNLGFESSPFKLTPEFVEVKNQLSSPEKSSVWSGDGRPRRRHVWIFQDSYPARWVSR